MNRSSIYRKGKQRGKEEEEEEDDKRGRDAPRMTRRLSGVALWSCCMSRAVALGGACASTSIGDRVRWMS